MPLVPPDDPRFVPTFGPEDADIVILGEAPGATEHKFKKPFVGWSGKKLDSLLAKAGIARATCLIGNVCPIKPPGNKISLLSQIDVDLNEEKERCREWITAHPRRLVIVLGNTALECLTGKTGIMNYRGSLIPKEMIEFSFDIFCMVHPAAIARDWKLDAIAKADMIKLRKYLAAPEFDDKIADLYIYGKNVRRSLRIREEIPTPTTCEYFLNHIRTAENAELLAFDIETFAETITVFGFSTEDRAVSIPFTGQFTEIEEAQLIEAIRDLLKKPMPKITQNGIYDCTYLADQWGVEVNNHIWDTMLMHHCIYAELPHDLGFLVSVYTDTPFFKRMAKEATTANYNEAMWEYNALDVFSTYRIRAQIALEITHYKQWDVYWEYYVELSHVLAPMQQRGVRIDRNRREELIKEFTINIEKSQEDINKIVGEEFNIKSPKQMKNYVHGVLKLPKIRKRGAQASVQQTTLDKTARATLKRKYPKHTAFFDAVDDIAKHRDLLSKYLGLNAKGDRKYMEDHDGRVRTSFNIAGNSRTDDQAGGAETGRLSSSTNCYGRGCNMQNQPKGLRDLYLPDPGYILWQADWQSAESYIVGWLSGDPAMMDVLTNHRLYKQNGPTKVMMHEAVGSIITGLSPEKITGKWRDLAKRCGHARNYGVAPPKLAEVVNNQLPEIPFGMKEAQTALDELDNAFWGVKDWRSRTRQSIIDTRRLYNIFGHMRMFFSRLSDNLYREAYAHVPQSSVGVGLNRSLILLHNELKEREDIVPFLQVHDSIMGQCKIGREAETESIVSRILERELPCECNGLTLRIPCDFSTGNNWKECG